MPKTVIAICTYRRVDRLARALDALENQRLSSHRDEDIALAVIDNSPEASARDTVLSFSSTSRFKVDFTHEPRKGLSYARNTAVGVARRLGGARLAFVDDDGMPEPVWFEALTQRMDESGAGAAIGPVYPVFSQKPPAYLPVSAYATRPARVGPFVTDGYTCNVLLDLELLDRLGMSFDLKHNATGGEDTLFFKAFIDSGNRIAYAPDAVILESFAPNRMKAKWLMLKWYRTGSLEAQLGPYPAHSTQGRLRNFAKGVTRVVAGGGLTAVSAVLQGWHNPRATVLSCYTMCRGAGLIANVFGKDYKAYDQPNYS